ncbi:PadR family transcriptional regulator [Comamonas aquatica]
MLHHAAEQEIYGQWMIDELAHHGYRLSPGTLYPMLHKMERDGYLVSRQEREGRTVRKLYTITSKGKEGLALAKERIREFTGEAMHK